MCGIFGLIGNRNSDTRKLSGCVRSLFLLSESRGKEASGFAALYNRTIHVYRTSTQAHELITQRVFADALSALSHEQGDVAIVGHSRIATNGSPYVDINNQPVIGKESVMVHNGVIVNENALWKKYFPNIKKPELDTAVMVRILDYFIEDTAYDMANALIRLYKEIEGEASVAILTRRRQSLFLATNTGSLYAAKTNSGMLVFSSERYITHTALKHMRDSGVITPLCAGQIIEIPFATLKPSFVHKQTQMRYSPQYSIVRIPSLNTSFIPIRHLYNNTLRMIKSHMPDVDAIEKIPRCTKCILPVTMPLIRFDADGVCNFCRTYTKQLPKGKTSLESFIAPFRSTNGSADCIVALSGGRDSSYGLHYVKKVLGLNPVAYTYDWGMVTDVARRNQSRMVSKLGIEHIWVSADINRKRENIRRNVEAWLAKPDIAMVPLFMAGDKQAEYYVEELKRKTRINLVFYCRGNQLEDERFKFGYYGIFDGTPKGVIHNLSLKGKITMASYFAKACLANPRYINSSLTDTLFAYASSYLMPHKNFVYLWHYIPWFEKEIVSTLKNLYGWEGAPDTVATWRIDDGTPPFYNYIYYHIQGFTEHDGLRSNQIRERYITRNEALRLVKQENIPRYESLKFYFDMIGIDADHALSVVDRIPTRY